MPPAAAHYSAAEDHGVAEDLGALRRLMDAAVQPGSPSSNEPSKPSAI